MQQSKLDNYRSERGAQAYKADHQNRLHRKYSDRIERRILGKYFEILDPCKEILDMPCGHGRFFDFLSEHSERVIEADVSPTMLDLNAKDHQNAAADYIECSALEPPMADRSVDTIVSIRLSHHFNVQEDRERHLRELFRVADRAVIMTYFSFLSLKNTLRRFQRLFSKKGPKNTLATSRVRSIAASGGFDVVRLVPLSRVGSGHIYALFIRKGS